MKKTIVMLLLCAPSSLLGCQSEFGGESAAPYHVSAADGGVEGTAASALKGIPDFWLPPTSRTVSLQNDRTRNCIERLTDNTLKVKSCRNTQRQRIIVRPGFCSPALTAAFCHLQLQFENSNRCITRWSGGNVGTANCVTGRKSQLWTTFGRGGGRPRVFTDTLAATFSPNNVLFQNGNRLNTRPREVRNSRKYWEAIVR